MRLAFGDRSVETARIDSREALARDGALVLGTDAEHAQEYFSLTVTDLRTSAPPLQVVVCSEGHGLPPQILLRPGRDEILLGFNSEVCALEVAGGSLLRRAELGSLFRDFVEVPPRGLVLALHELGVTALNDELEQVWSCAQDVVQDWGLEPEALTLTFMDAPPLRLSLVDGSPIHGLSL